ncbi:hypothetical protein GH714_017205 [Hevea brasiliensis]|uniref:Uncharacterized protein n=1 Tax=Hevea brasiliensis TaxID=3981 RepID=A0A6A6N8H2_HEVBR|nr:hypothetical protein GH714_017205 [Hevea brasiliensis]
MDVTDIAEKGAEDVYRTFNVLMRRKPKENNFKAILESIRDLMNEYCIVPDWLHNIFLGYGNPSAAQWTNMPDLLETVDFKDTFLDADHLKESFPDYQVCFVNADSTENLNLRPPFRIRLPRTLKGNTHALPGNKKLTIDSMNDDDMEDAGGEKEKLIVEAYIPPDPGPYPQDQPKQNSVRFTPTQIGAILSGIQPGLTMVVGPPGTGKTDTAVQILNVLYHNCPSQRTLIITHSNQALNDLFEKIMQRDVPARYLLRLGQGEQELATDLDFSRQGRVNAMLVRRLELLNEVERLARSLQLPEDVGYTCETAGYFWLLHVYSRWEQFLAACEDNKDKPTFVQDRFPFKEFFSNTPQPVLTEAGRWLCTAETLHTDWRSSSVTPSLKNMAFQKYSHMDQSLFTRFVRLGIPYIELNAQGRARPSIAKLYNWRYRDLGDLPYVKEGAIFHKANAGFSYEYQLVDVPDYHGRGETAPSPWFYQNEGEAEYVVSVYIYMRLLGYPANKISILTTYNGQKLLIRDVINRRCVPYDFIGPPSKVTTVDKFQGQQNDFILLSLVRTRFVGHLRDVRRLVVAMSRARLGLYVFCRRSLFEQCYELQPTFQLLLQRPDHLALNLNEISSYIERPVEDIGQPYLVSGVEEMGHIARLMNYQFEQYHSSNMSAPANGAVDDTLHESKSEEAQEMDGIESGQNGDLPLQSQRNGERDAKLVQMMKMTGERCSASSSLYTGGEDNWGRFFRFYLKDAILEGGNPFEKAHGVPMYKHISLNQESVKNFNKAMDNLSSYILSKVLDTYSGFRGLNSLVDVGGGSGVAINMIISKYPSISAINFDLPHVIKEAPPRPGVKHVGGDMFSGIPSAEAIMMKDVLHNWSDEHCIKILKNCHDALPKGGREAKDRERVQGPRRQNIKETN